MMAFIDSVQLLSPIWLWLWLPAALLLLLLLRCDCLLSQGQWSVFVTLRLYRHPRQKLLRHLNSHTDTRWATVAVFPRWISYAMPLLCFHLALAQPYIDGHQLPSDPEYRDTVFIIDTSISMVLKDYIVAGRRVQRMTILKSILSAFIDGLEGNRIGLIVFSERPYTLLPLTSDYELLKSRVHRLIPAVLTGNSSNIGKALVYTLQQLQREDASSQTQKPVLVLLTDVDRSSRDLDPRAVAAYIQQQGYRLYVIGIGTSSYEAEDKKSTGLIYQPTNFSLLEAIAQKGGGQFYWAKNAMGLQDAIHKVQAGELRKVNSEPKYMVLSLYQWPLLAGLLWIMALQAVKEMLDG